MLPSESAENLLFLLEQASLPAPLPMLRARERWILLMETLLGHGAIRGGRSRDFPFSTQRDQALSLAASLVDVDWSFVPGRDGPACQICLHHVLAALYCIGIARASAFDDALEEECYYSTALHSLLEALFPRSESIRVLDLLGLGTHGREISGKMRRRLRKDFRLASLISTLATNEVPDDRQALPWLVEVLRLRDADILELRNLKVGLLVLKVKGAQRFLDKCRRSFIQRGASAWCSLIASRTRDHLSQLASLPLGLLMDNEAVTVFLCPPNTCFPDIERQIRGLLLSGDGLSLSPTFVQTFCPRLSPYFEVAVSEGQNTTLTLPELGYELRSDCSLLEIAIPGALCLDSQDDSHFSRSIFALSSSVPLPSSERCSGHALSAVYRQPGFEAPLWYNRGSDQAYGFAAAAFSLAEITFSRMMRQSIREHLKDKHKVDVVTPETVDAMLRLLGPKDSLRLCVLKYDGDSIGELFRSAAMVSRPATSLRLETAIRKCWINTVAGIIQNDKLKGNPIDMVYWGGDDLLITLPDCLLVSFLAGFDRELNKAGWSELSFTFAALDGIEAAQYKEFNYLGEVNSLLKVAKRVRKGEQDVPLDGDVLRYMVFSQSGGLVQNQSGVRLSTCND